MHSRGRILFIDDEPQVREDLASLLAEHGFAADVAADGWQALGLARGGNYAVVASDVYMSGENGLDIVRRLQALQPDASYLIVTGDLEFRLPGDMTRVQEVIYKPWDPERLIASIDHAVEQHHARLASAYVARATLEEPQRKQRVLLIEDRAADADFIKLALPVSELGEFVLRTACDMRAGLQQLQEERFDAVLVDLTLPDVQGLCVVARIHALAPRLPVLVLSDRDDPHEAFRAAQVGAQDYLVKAHLDRRSFARSIGFAVERRRAQHRIEYMVSYNYLTGLPNEALFRERLQQALARANRSETQVGLMLLGIDRFKAINDALGQEVGDRFLCCFAERLKACLRQGETLAHLRGDEFAVVLEALRRSDDASAAANRFLQELSKPFRVGERDVFATTSAGIALYPASSSAEQLLHDADEAMYRAKKQGRNQVYLRRRDTERLQSQLSLEADLSGALERGEYVLHYQPKVDAQSRHVSGVEALLRWEHPTQGRMSPLTFIPLLEETGLIVDVGEWVLREACLQSKRWTDEGLGDVAVSVNLSARQFQPENIVHTVARVLQDTGIDPRLVALELTESLLFDRSDDTLERLSLFKQMGVRLSIDDFGTGYSSLAYLNRYPIDELKIDRSFVRALPDDTHCATIASAIIGLSRNLGLQSVAEGVETERQLKFLRNRGCNEIQGFLYAAPMPAADLAQWLASHGQSKVA